MNIMKKDIFKSSVIATLGLLLIFVFGADAFAQLAKQGEFTGTAGYSGKVLKVHSIGKAPKFIVVEYFGATKNDAGSGLYHNMSFDCTFSVDIPEMPKTIGTGYCTVFDSDKDTFTIKVSAKGVLGGGGMQPRNSLMALGNTRE